jgi:hypothetical protein
MQPGKRSLLPLPRFERLGLIRFALTLPREVSKLNRADTYPDLVSAADAKVAKAAFEAKKAKVVSEAQRILILPR